MLDFFIYVFVSVIILIMFGLLLINNLLVNIKTNLKELHQLHKDIVDK